jgi:hypothetical protein
VADFLVGGHSDAASGAKMIPLLRMGEVIATICAMALAHHTAALQIGHCGIKYLRIKPQAGNTALP